MKRKKTNSKSQNATILFMAVMLLLSVIETAAADNKDGARFFDSQKLYTDELYVIKDHLEFTVFDLSQMKIEDASGTRKYAPAKETSLPQQGAPASLSAETEIRSVVAKTPKIFYAALQKQILKEKVPVTVYSTKAPEYANPIKLYIKIKEVKLKPVEIDKKGDYLLPVRMRIYGQIKDKRSGKILMRYYDSAGTVIALKKNLAGAGFETMATDLMGRLARFLKSRY